MSALAPSTLLSRTKEQSHPSKGGCTKVSGTAAFVKKTAGSLRKHQKEIVQEPVRLLSEGWLATKPEDPGLSPTPTSCLCWHMCLLPLEYTPNKEM